MPNRNLVVVIGHLGRDPEVRYTTNGHAICSLTVAATDKWQDKKTGEWKENTEWVKVSIFGELAELVGQEFKKGDAIHIEGKQTTRKYTDKEGVEKYSTEVNSNYVARPLYVKKAKEQAKPSGGAFMSDVDDSIPW